MTAEALLSVADVARLRGCDHSTAWRLLVRLEREHGAHLVRQRRVIHISHDELRQALARLSGTYPRRLAHELAATKRRVAVLEAWKRAVTEELRSLRRVASALSR